MDTFSKSTVEAFLKENGCVCFGEINGKMVWIKSEVVIISIPIRGKIDYDEFEFIAIEQLNIGYWEFDYWLGEKT